ncbi:MAG: hypothetical protein JRH07_07380 [Deltaproteobacteria bacterium]|nr:hypothetical protein [Deltaproteobacteria bacterium]
MDLEREIGEIKRTLKALDEKVGEITRSVRAYCDYVTETRVTEWFERYEELTGRRLSGLERRIQTLEDRLGGEKRP